LVKDKLKGIEYEDETMRNKDKTDDDENAIWREAFAHFSIVLLLQRKRTLPFACSNRIVNVYNKINR